MIGEKATVDRLPLMVASVCKAQGSPNILDMEKNSLQNNLILARESGYSKGKRKYILKTIG